MLTPKDIATIPVQSDSAALAQQASIEFAFDKALKDAARTESWPAVMPSGGRSGWTSRNIAAVADKYRSAGWVVHCDDPFRTTIDKP